jgi:polar amino acid transport system permease protein
MLDWDWNLVGRIIVSPLVFNGLWATIWSAVVAQGSGTILGVIFAQMGLSRNMILRAMAAFYSWLFRGTPLLVQILFTFAVLPLVGIKLDALTCGFLSLGINEGARMAEIVRAGLISVDLGQTEAAKALGMSGLQTFRFVVMPQAIRVITPPLGNEFNGMLKTTSLLAVVGGVELLRTAQMLASVTFRPLEVYITISLFYLALTTIWERIQSSIERRVRIKGSVV